MIKLGITGGIGSGKSTICRVFSVLGIPVYESDSRAKLLMNKSSLIKQSIKQKFGDNIYTADESLDRKKLASIVFNQPELLQALNQIVHPAVRTDFMQWSEAQSSPYVIQESAILFNSDFHKLMDKTITVSAPIEQRISRVKMRDNCSREDVLSRMKNQIDDDKLIALSSFVIYNNENDLVLEQVLKIDKILRNG